ncbi:TolC family protein [Erwinia endophytica]|uniref:TolC family protein n=1 Tax=Erwinia endophytica TaxID=1563158 RepID=UPI001265FC32|nr:TolC family protein [Erwinia endophytica]KAB8312334.1 TolC family protein [Erwinia endophytica]
MNSIMLIIFGLIVVSFNSNAMTIEEAIKSGIDYNLNIKMSETEKEISHYKVEESYASYWPQVTLTGKSRTSDHRYSDEYVRDDDESAMLNFGAQYTILDLARYEQVNAAKSALDVQTWGYKIDKEKLTFQIIKAYIDVWRKKRTLEIGKEYLNQVTGLTEKVKLRVEGGLSPSSDLVRSEASVDDAKTRLENAEKDFVNAKINLSSLIGRNDDISTMFNENSHPVVPKFISNNELEHINLLLKQLDSDIQQKQYEYQFTRKSDYPKVQFLANYKQRNQSVDSPDLQFYIQVTVPIFTGFMSTNKINEAAADVRLSNYKRESALRDLNKNYNSTKSSIEKEVSIWELNNNAIINSRRTLELYQNEFNLGSRPLSDIIDAQRELQVSLIDMVDAKANFYDYVAAAYNLCGDTDKFIKFI